MKSTSEVGQVKNLGNFEVMISFCTAYGATYNPARNSIKVPQLVVLFNSASLAMQTVKTTATAKSSAVNKRKILFDKLPKLSTRILNSLDATEATKETVSNAKTFHRKIQGKSVPKSSKSVKLSETEAEPLNSNKKSSSQRSFDNQIDHFAKLIATLSAEPLYLPNEAELKLTALNSLLTSMKSLNSMAVNAKSAHSNAMIARNVIMDADLTGLVEIAGDVKKYVKSVFGATSEQYKQISALKFVRIKH